MADILDFNSVIFYLTFPFFVESFLAAFFFVKVPSTSVA